MKNFYKSIFMGVIGLVAASSCDVEPEFYSQVVPETFYTSQDAVWQRFNRPFTHWRWYHGESEARWFLQELGTDEFCIPTRGSNWFDGGIYQSFHHHKYREDMIAIDAAWSGLTMGIALAWDALEDLNEVDFDQLGFEPGTRESMLAQQTVLAASLYLDGLDLFGGIPLYTTTQSEVKGRSTDVETFNFVDSLLTVAMPNLPVKTEMGAKETGQIHQAVAAALKARLYFNAEAYIKKPMYTEAAQICQDILNGKYGAYELDADYRSTFGFDNEYSHEILWSVPSDNIQLPTGLAIWVRMVPGMYYNYLGSLESSPGWNGMGLVPGLDPKGNPYNFKLGSPYRKFNDKDIRKKNYVYYGNGNYEGIFMVGELINPVNPNWYCAGLDEANGTIANLVDQVARFSELGTKYSSADELESNIATGEANSCVRVLKWSPRPTANEANLRCDPDLPMIRLAEIYYMLAECKMRAGDKSGAANLINTVRKRYFPEGDPDPVTAANLDKYRMLDEWMVEFVGEARRRTDLVRWDAYVTEDWWDHKATNNANLNRFPIHYSTLGANQLLVQNPGY